VADAPEAPEEDSAGHRVWRQVAVDPRQRLRAGLSPSALRTALLEVARSRAAAVTPRDVVRRWREDRLVRPGTGDPRLTAAVEAAVWALLPSDVEGVELSPVTPLGTCTAVAPGSQDRIVATMRGTEVLSDLTNALAVEAAVRREAQDRDGEVHLAACAPVLRAQPFPAGWSQHFRLFAVVSSAGDTGSGRTQAGLLLRHVQIWQRVLATLAGEHDPRVELAPFEDSAVAERLTDTVLPAVNPEVPVTLAPDRTRGRGYYTGAALRLTVRREEVGDGGLTTWTAQLSGNAKERCMVSCLATTRLAALAA